MSNEEERRLILEMIANGKISAKEGLDLINSLGEADESENELETTRLSLVRVVNADEEEGDEIPLDGKDSEPLVGEVAEPGRVKLPSDADRWRRWWRLPFWIGVGVTILGGVLMYWAQLNTGFGFLFFCSWLPFLLGLGLMVLSWQSRTSRWLHLRIHQAEGEWPQNIALSFPIPIRATAWFFRIFGGQIPGMEQTSIDELILALGDTATPENPLYVEVEDNEDGERVEVFIG